MLQNMKDLTAIQKATVEFILWITYGNAPLYTSINEKGEATFQF